MGPRLQSNLGFRLMALAFRLRDRLRPPIRILQETGIQSGMTVLDFGCGPGGFSLAAARLVGPEGRVFALDVHPLALKSVRRAAAKHGLRNLQPVEASAFADLPKASMDLALLYDVLHGLSDPVSTLAEIHRVLKPEGRLSVSDHHLKEKAVARVTAGGLFRLASRGRGCFQFERNDSNGAAP